VKCVICGRSIGRKEFKSYTFVRRSRHGTPAKVYACSDCKDDAFDRWIDSLPTDGAGYPLLSSTETPQSK